MSPPFLIKSKQLYDLVRTGGEDDILELTAEGAPNVQEEKLRAVAIQTLFDTRFFHFLSSRYLALAIFNYLSFLYFLCILLLFY